VSENHKLLKIKKSEKSFDKITKIIYISFIREKKNHLTRNKMQKSTVITTITVAIIDRTATGMGAGDIALRG
jgi:2-iminoacetate synthase ThiH